MDDNIDVRVTYKDGSKRIFEEVNYCAVYNDVVHIWQDNVGRKYYINLSDVRMVEEVYNYNQETSIAERLKSLIGNFYEQ